MELALIHRRTPFISLQKGRSVSTMLDERRLVVHTMVAVVKYDGGGMDSGSHRARFF